MAISMMALTAMQAGLEIQKGIGQAFNERLKFIRAENQARLQEYFVSEAIEDEKERAEFEKIQMGKQFDKYYSKQKTAIASSGIEMTGTALQILEETDKNRYETMKNIRESSFNTVKRLEFEKGQLQETQRQLKKGKKNVFRNQLIKTGSNIASMYVQNKMK